MKKILALLLAMVMVCALCACGGDKADEPAAAPEAPVADNAAPAPEAPAAPETPAEGDASGEPSGNPAPSTGDFEITVDGKSGTAHYEDTDNGDQATKSFQVTFDGVTMTGTIDKGVWVADDAANQAVIDAVHEAFEAQNPQPGSGEPSEEPAA